MADKQDFYHVPKLLIYELFSTAIIEFEYRSRSPNVM